MSLDFDYLFKICIVGDPGIGKESYVKSFVGKDFITKDIKKTIGVRLYNKKVLLESDRGSINCGLQIWDIVGQIGQKRFDLLKQMYIRRSLGFILFFDLANRDSFIHLTDYIKPIINEKRKVE